MARDALMAHKKDNTTDFGRSQRDCHGDTLMTEWTGSAPRGDQEYGRWMREELRIDGEYDDEEDDPSRPPNGPATYGSDGHQQSEQAWEYTDEMGRFSGPEWADAMRER
jgi:hypothetical protein